MDAPPAPRRTGMGGLEGQLVLLEYVGSLININHLRKCFCFCVGAALMSIGPAPSCAVRGWAAAGSTIDGSCRRSFSSRS